MLEREWFDHAPLKFVFSNREGYMDLGDKPIRFEIIWVEDAGCEQRIHTTFRSGGKSAGAKL